VCCYLVFNSCNVSNIELYISIFVLFMFTNFVCGIKIRKTTQVTTVYKSAAIPRAILVHLMMAK
jgi:hypothetical protein